MKKIISLFVLFGLSACATGYGFLNAENLRSDAALEMQQTLMGGQNLDLSRVYTVRMLVNGTRVDVSSLNPEILALEGKEDNRAATVLTYSPDRTHMIFFTRNPETGEGYLRRITLAELRLKPAFEFPMVVGTTITSAKFEVIDVTVLP